MPDRFPFAGPVEVIAHRGFSARAPENTIAAMLAAIDAGADAVEFDVHAAADGTPFLFHDAKLHRTTNGRGPIAESSPERLAELDAGGWFDPRFRGEPIPTLVRALDVVRGRVGRVYAEVKGYREVADVDVMVDVVRDAGMLGETVFISLDWRALARVRDVEPASAIGYIVDERARIDDGMMRSEGDPEAMLDFDAKLLLRDPAVAERAHDRGIEIATWTVNRVTDAERLLRMGVRRITTNEVADLLAWKAGL